MAFDIGTYSARLLVADVRGGDLRAVRKSSLITGLGRGVDASGRLGDAAIERTLAALRILLDEGRALGARRACAMATSAVREASNASRLIEGAAGLGLNVDVISGRREAQLGFSGATGGRGGWHGVLDIGGGSTEAVAGLDGSIRFSRSVPLGVQRALDRFAWGDPPDAGRLRALES